MKKIYQAPEVNVVAVKQQLMTGTSQMGKSSTTVSSNDDVLSREFDSWDDED